jgi:hypothetical protein
MANVVVRVVLEYEGFLQPLPVAFVAPYGCVGHMPLPDSTHTSNTQNAYGPAKPLDDICSPDSVWDEDVCAKTGMVTADITTRHLLARCLHISFGLHIRHSQTESAQHMLSRHLAGPSVSFVFR